METNFETIFIGFANQKGGAGKTTLTHLTAKTLALARGKKVRVIECDPQGSMTEVKRGVLEENPGTSIPYDLIFSPICDVGATAQDSHGKYDFVFIDMPGTLDKEGILAMLTNADILIVPIIPSQYDLDSSIEFLETLYKVADYKRKNGAPFHYYTLRNRQKPKTRKAKELSDVLEDNKISYMDSILKDLVGYVENQENFDNPLSKKTPFSFEFGKFIDELLSKVDVLKEELAKIEAE